MYSYLRCIGFESPGERSSASSSVIKVRSMSTKDDWRLDSGHQRTLMSAAFCLCDTLPSMESRTHIQSTAAHPHREMKRLRRGAFHYLFWHGRPLPRRYHDSRQRSHLVHLSNIHDPVLRCETPGPKTQKVQRAEVSHLSRVK